MQKQLVPTRYFQALVRAQTRCTTALYGIARHKYIHRLQSTMITIDGSTLEGGGQLTRLALCLSAITQQPIRIHSIRAGRRANRQRQGNVKSVGRTDTVVGGLKDSHLGALEFLAEHSYATVMGASVGSTEVVFRPSKTRTESASLGVGRSEFAIRLKKPGSVWLIFQAILPFILFRTDWTGLEWVVLQLVGGTNVPKAMSSEYVVQVFAPVLERISGSRLEASVRKRGWAGDAAEIGEVEVKVSRPLRENVDDAGRFLLEGFEVTKRGDVAKIAITVVASPSSMRAALIEGLTSTLDQGFSGVRVDVAVDDSSEDDRRLYVLLVAHTTNGWRLGRDYLGSGRTKSPVETKTKIREICMNVVEGLKREIETGGCVDKHMQDQLVGFQALASGVSTVEGGSIEITSKRAADSKTRQMKKVYVDEDGNEVKEDKIEQTGDEGGTLHTRTVRWVSETILDRYGIQFNDGGVCHGVGWNGKNSNKPPKDDLGLSDLDIYDDNNT